MTEPTDTLDVRALLFPLTPAEIGRHYDHVQRTRDFRAVFFGEASAVQKERVLYQILQLGRPVSRFDGPVLNDTNRVMFELGRREVAIQLMDILHHQIPSEAPAATTQSNEGRTAT